jgi:hypothetical protein
MLQLSLEQGGFRQARKHGGRASGEEADKGSEVQLRRVLEAFHLVICDQRSSQTMVPGHCH